MESKLLLRSVLKRASNSYSRVVKWPKPLVFHNGFSNYSTESAHAHEMVKKEKIQLTKPSIKKWKRPPFIKSLFLGKFDVELMAFPEILNKEQLLELETNVKHLKEFMAQKVDSVAIDIEQKIPQSVLNELKDLGMFGRMIPVKYGGLDLTYSACTRLNEVIGLDWSVCSTLLAHEFFASQVILNWGTEEQKLKYLPKLASGDIIAALACCEAESGSDILSISTTAVINPDGKSYNLNGSKCWVTNADIAGVFIVFLKADDPLSPNHKEITAFIVDKESEGITIEPQEKICLRGMNVGKVHFHDTPVPLSNRLGAQGAGPKVYLKALESFRIAQNSFTFGTLKSFIDSITHRIIQDERVDTSLGDFQAVRYRLSKINSMLYAMESVAYFTAALIDSTENPDVELESAALKIFNSEGTLYCIRQLLELVGSKSLVPGMLLERYYRDALGLAMFDTPNDVVKVFLGLTGCKVVGKEKNRHIEKLRNRAHYPSFTMKEQYRHWKIMRGSFKYDYDIAGHLHPSLVASANELEHNLQLFEVHVERTLELYGPAILESQPDAIRLANIATYLYAWSAVLSRASRSYCIGLKNSHHELSLATTFCDDIDVEVKRIIYEIANTPIKNNQKNHLLLGEQVLDCQGYFPEHPLKHNL